MKSGLWKAALVVAVFSLAMNAGTISLTNDFSISNGNPNGQWAYGTIQQTFTLQIPQKEPDTAGARDRILGFG